MGDPDTFVNVLKRLYSNLGESRPAIADSGAFPAHNASSHAPKW